MKPKEFARMAYGMADKDCGICPPPIEAQTGLNVLISHFLGDDWYVSLPLGTKQVNTEAVLEILERFPNPERYDCIKR